jgi:imidazolonepropionase-like amidohydrolase
LPEALGTIEVGKVADLVLLEGNPVDDIANISRIAAVVSDGRYFARPGIDAMMSEVASRAREESFVVSPR